MTTIEQRLREFVGFLSADVPELHQVEIPRLAESVQRFLAVIERESPRLIQGVVSEDEKGASDDPRVMVGDRFRFTMAAIKHIYQEPDHSTVVVRCAEIVAEDDGCKRVIVTPE